MAENYFKKEQERLELLITQAYYTAAFERNRKLPKLKEILNKLRTRKQPNKRSDNLDEIREIAKSKGLNIPQ